MDHKTLFLGLEACVASYTYLSVFLDQNNATIEFLRVALGCLGPLYFCSGRIFVFAIIVGSLRKIVANNRNKTLENP